LKRLMGRDQEELLDTADTSGLAMKLSLPLSKAGFNLTTVMRLPTSRSGFRTGVSSYPAPP